MIIISPYPQPSMHACFVQAKCITLSTRFQSLLPLAKPTDKRNLVGTLPSPSIRCSDGHYLWILSGSVVYHTGNAHAKINLLTCHQHKCNYAQFGVKQKQYLFMGVDTRGALRAEAPSDFQALYYTLYVGMAKIIGFRPKHEVIIVAQPKMHQNCSKLLIFNAYFKILDTIG